MNSWVSIVISLVALGVSVTSAWLTWFKKGELRMTQPTVLFFGPDGGGPSVPREGIACNHHFLLPEDGKNFKLESGEYVLRLYARKANSSSAKELTSVTLRISEEYAPELQDDDAGIYFDWEPSQQTYFPLIDKKPPENLPQFLLDLNRQQ